jgi:hypothetical protein
MRSNSREAVVVRESSDDTRNVRSMFRTVGVRVGRILSVSVVVDERFAETDVTPFSETTSEDWVLVVDSSIDDADLSRMKDVISQESRRDNGKLKRFNTHSNSISENPLFVQLVDSGHDVRREDVVLVVRGRVADGRVVGEVRDVFVRRVAVNGVGVVDRFGTRYDADGPSALYARNENERRPTTLNRVGRCGKLTLTPLIVSKPLTTSSQFASSPLSFVGRSCAATTAPAKT